jgi:N-acetylglutamate synthase-like GNAT family acetyltransferase
MKGQRSYCEASCRLVVSTAIPFSMRAAVREVVALYTPPEMRSCGYASQLMHDVCREADEHNITLLLVVDHDIMRLVPWYTRFGFQTIQAKPIMMARMVKATPLTLKPLDKAMHDSRSLH